MKVLHLFILITLTFNAFGQRNKKAKLNCIPHNDRGNILAKDIESRIIGLIEGGDFEKLEVYLTKFNVNPNYAINKGYRESFLTIAIAACLKDQYRNPINTENSFVKVINVLIKHNADPYATICDQRGPEDFIWGGPDAPTTAIALASANPKLLQLLTANSSSNSIVFERQMIENSIKAANISLITDFANSNQSVDLNGLVYKTVSSDLTTTAKQLIISSLLKKGGNINENYSEGYQIKNAATNAITKAIDLKDLSLVIFLIENRVDVNSKSNSGITPLGMAVFANNLAIVELLLKNGANSKLKSSYPGYYNDSYVALSDIAKSEEMKDFLLLSN